jgi:hypothetical protein
MRINHWKCDVMFLRDQFPPKVLENVITHLSSFIALLAAHKKIRKFEQLLETSFTESF